MLKTIWGARWLLLLGLLTFLITLLITMPLHFVWRYLEPQLQGLPVQVTQVRGSIWQGNARLLVPQLSELGAIQGHWQVQPWSLFRAKLQVQLDLETSDLRLQLPLTLAPNQIAIDAGHGYLDLVALKPILARERGSAEGAVELQRLQAKVALDPVLIETMAGQLTYTGGAVSILIDNKPVNSSMPPLLGQLTNADGQTKLQASTIEGLSLFDAFIKDDGWAGIIIKRNFIDALGQTWPMQAEPDDVVFEVSRKVL